MRGGLCLDKLLCVCSKPLMWVLSRGCPSYSGLKKGAVEGQVNQLSWAFGAWIKEAVVKVGRIMNRQKTGRGGAPFACSVPGTT